MADTDGFPPLTGGELPSMLGVVLRLRDQASRRDALISAYLLILGCTVAGVLFQAQSRRVADFIDHPHRQHLSFPHRG
ncbi:hypothetical protein ACQE3D_16235 [Methylomonas sp. MS20]|uniref:hypothetical protein n=1 Tax=unclassified Methylomonas TaxID=2608980 RepID=UPI0028A4F0C3|nr:hypothetical protein [Methylomonas sp. MV1]MDT4331084.1 hypothetical protein [Methylomonas sp. MV1]